VVNLGRHTSPLSPFSISKALPDVEGRIFIHPQKHGFVNKKLTIRRPPINK